MLLLGSLAVWEDSGSGQILDEWVSQLTDGLEMEIPL